MGGSTKAGGECGRQGQGFNERGKGKCHLHSFGVSRTAMPSSGREGYSDRNLDFGGAWERDGKKGDDVQQQMWRNLRQSSSHNAAPGEDGSLVCKW